MEKKIYVIHENDDWTRHLVSRLAELNLPYEAWHLASGHFLLPNMPPPGVFYNRMSASSHTRGHRYAPELAGAVLDWLEFHGRRVVNGSRALQLELSKIKQYTALERAGIKTPKTLFAVGKDQIIAAAESFAGKPFVTKHNRAGKGLGVHLLESVAALTDYVNGPDFEDSVDGITLVQEYIESPGGYITRAEFVGGKFLYSVRVLTGGSFQLCPADNCRIEFTSCPAGYNDETTNLVAAIPQVDLVSAAPEYTDFAESSDQPMQFEIIATPETITEPYRTLIDKYEVFLQKNDIEVAGIEFIEDAAGNIYTYDVNTNTNYNKDAEAKAGKYAMLELAKYLSEQLATADE